MDNPDEFLDAYFSGDLSGADRQRFAAACGGADAFIRQVARYLAFREAARQVLLACKRREWQAAAQERGLDRPGEGCFPKNISGHPCPQSPRNSPR
ncbi:hypothetical protein V9K67_04950 [Paraflavisolibacter sp. H34]|uniref:hypothetical protein n=1 Tax=Huijunlia imazamoxiresistens TaxID=3127457 RepID=UPI00301B126D